MAKIVVKDAVKREKGYFYYVDKEGSVCATPLKQLLEKAKKVRNAKCKERAKAKAKKKAIEKAKKDKEKAAEKKKKDKEEAAEKKEKEATKKKKK
jgi:hypothetical protein